MTDQPANDGIREQEVKAWLTRHQRALDHALGEVLDIEAGLREVLVHSQHDAATEGLDAVLDTEAGLAAILPSTPPAPGLAADDTAPAHTVASTREFLHSISPAKRMTLRNHPDIQKASHALDRDLSSALALDLDLSSAIGSALSLAHDLSSAIALDLDRALNRARARPITRELDRAFGSARDLDRALNRALHRARALNRRNPGMARALGLDVELEFGPELDNALSIALQLGFVLELVLELARTSDRDLDRDLGRALDRDRDLTRTLDRDLDRDLAQAVIHHVVDVRAREVGRAIGLVLHCTPPTLDTEAVHIVLNDFTHTDLSTADLTDLDLVGVHWSPHTTSWPATMDVEELKAISEETPPGSGTFIVQSGTATARDLSEL